MNSLFMNKYKPAIILTLALTVFLVSSKLPGKSWVVSTLAGGSRYTSWFGYGYLDATGEAALFNDPLGVAVDSSGNLYVADTWNHRIRKITSAGVVTTLAGSGTRGFADGAAATARFNEPRGVAVDSSGNVYVADYNNHRIRKITSAGVVSTLAGSTEGHKDAPGTAAQFNEPRGVTVDSSGNVYVADYGNHRIRKITSAGVVSTLAGEVDIWGEGGHHDATGTAARFNEPYGVAVDSSGNVYVADYGNHRIRKITSTGVVSTFAGSGTAGNDDATGTAAQFRYPSGVAVDSSGNVYVADSGNHRIRKITPGGVVSTIGNPKRTYYDAARGIPAEFDSPIDVAVDSSGNVYVADSGNHRIRKITPARGVSTLAGSTEGYKEGTGTEAQFNKPSGVAVDSSGNVYVTDTNNHRIRKTTSAGVVTTLAGSGTAGHQDATGTAAQFNSPSGVAVDSSDNVYVADYSNHRIRKITSKGVVTTLAGTGTAGFANGAGTEAQFNGPFGVAVDSPGNVYVADSSNHRIRKITPAGVVSTFAGSGTVGHHDATGTAAQFDRPVGVAVVGSGDNAYVYVADTDNHRIRKITPAGVVSTLAGSDTRGFTNGADTAARFDYPTGVAVDSSGNVYVADSNNNHIRKITSAGVVSTLAGDGRSGYHDATGTEAQFNEPFGVAVDSSGNLYVADLNNHRIRKITPAGG